MVQADQVEHLVLLVIVEHLVQVEVLDQAATVDQVDQAEQVVLQVHRGHRAVKD